jgi:hypothetical protein
LGGKVPELPDTLTEFACGELALDATFTVTVIAGQLAPAFNTSLRVGVDAGRRRRRH